MPSNALENIKAFAEANPGSTWWTEELLFRGEPSDAHGGRLKGAHVVIGMRYTGPDGEEHTKITQPIPVGDTPADIPVADVLSDLHRSQQETADHHIGVGKKLTQQIEDLHAEHKQAVNEIHDKHREEIGNHLKRLTMLQGEHDAIKQHVGTLAAENSGLRSMLGPRAPRRSAGADANG